MCARCVSAPGRRATPALWSVSPESPGRRRGSPGRGVCASGGRRCAAAVTGESERVRVCVRAPVQSERVRGQCVCVASPQIQAAREASSAAARNPLQHTNTQTHS